MTMIRKLIRAEFKHLGDDEVEVVMSTAALARDGHVLIPQGCRLDNYRANPIVLWSHDPDKPIGNAEDVTVGPDKITARVRFAPLGISQKADEIRGLTKAGVIRAVSVGFDPDEMEPLDSKKPRAGQRISVWDLLELSFVSVPSDIGAIVTNRSHGDDTMLDDTDQPAGTAVEESRDGPAARARSARAPNITFKRGLYQVANLCYMFEELGWHVDLAKCEAATEGDGSKVPAMLAGVLHDLGDALLAMTQEEVAEALAGCDIEPDDDEGDIVLVIEERQHIAAASNPATRAFRRGLAHAKLRAGKTLSTETVRCLRDARTLHEEAVDLHRSAMRKHKDGIAAVNDLLDRSGATEPEGDAAPAAEALADAAGDDDTDGQRMSHAFRRRQADMLALAAS